MFERRTKKLPEDGVETRIVCGEKQREHVDCATNARGANQDAGQQCETNGQLTVRDEESEGSRMRQDEFLQDGNHKWVGAAVGQKTADPELEAATQSEL